MAALFLSNLNVMDYSLVVGVDSDKHELVVGIVDYIRTFTWSVIRLGNGVGLSSGTRSLRAGSRTRRSWVEARASRRSSPPSNVSGAICDPHVCSSADKTRFRTAMEKFYFPSVPDRWTKNAVEETLQEDESGGTITGTM